MRFTDSNEVDTRDGTWSWTRRVLSLSAILGSLCCGFAPVASATSCVALPQEGSIPANVARAARELRSRDAGAPCGLVERAERAFQNKRAVEAGLMSDEQAASQGGTALGGTGSLVVLPALFANTAAEPFNPVSLELQLFVFSNTGTLNDYYDEVSYGQFGIQGDVWGWVTVSGNDTAYEGSDNGYDGGAGDLLKETLQLNDPVVDFGQYDNDGPDGIPNSGDDDGYVDQVFIVHPKMGGECGDGASNNLWSHQSFYKSWFGSDFTTNDNRAGGGKIKINRYAMTPGLSCGGGMIEIGVFAHEFGHAIGIPDLYDTDEDLAGDSEGIGWWGLMGPGSWNTPSSPAHMTAFTRHRLGWLEYLIVHNDLSNLCVPPVEERPIAVQIWSFGMPTDEYFLVENRQAIGFDSQLPAEGLVIYHIDEGVYDAKRSTNSVNANEAHKAIDVECADAASWEHVVNADDLDTKANRGDAGDVWCLEGAQNRFNAITTPSTLSYSGVPTPVAVNNISTCDSSGGDIPADWICAGFTVGASNPVDVCIEDCPGDDCNQIATCTDWWGSPDIWIDNDEDGFHDLPAAGIENKIWIRVHNEGPDIAVATTVQVYLAPGAAGLEWPTDAAEYLGVTGYPVLDVGESGEDYLIFQYPDLFNLVGHYCIGAVVQQVEDPSYPGAAPYSNNIAQVNSQVLFARPGTPVADASSCPGDFSEETTVYLYDGDNPTGAAITAEIRIGSHPNYNDAVIPSNWNLDILPTQGPFLLNPGMRDSITVRFSSASASDGESAYVPLTLWDVRAHRVIGGTTISCETDCFLPLSPLGGSAEWTEFAGDDPVGPSVLVEWNPVFLDTNGGPERVMFYEVYRADDLPTPETLVDRVAIDGNPAAAKFQWFDDLPRSQCDITYTYRVRAVDPTGGAGEFSDPIVLQCSTTSTGDLSDDGQHGDGVDGSSWSDGGLSVFPNPMAATGSANVRFRLAGESPVEVAVFSAGGQKVRTLIEGTRTPGHHLVVWDGTDDGGRELPSGIYYCRLQAEGHQESRQIVRVR